MEIPISTAEPQRETTSQFQCNLTDRDAVRKIAHVLLLGLATACVDHTTGDPFRSPSSVSVHLRKELVDYLTLRSQSHVADTLLDPPSDPTPDHPADVVSDFAEDFAASNRSILGRVSGWILSETREDRIDDFVQEMEDNAFWFLDRREVFAETLLRNVDYRNEFHCVERFDDAEKLGKHRSRCPFRIENCRNEGCKASFCTVHAERHDGECVYKVLPCEQGCGESLVRREMDRHCITVCKMKLVNCAFYPVGCRSTIPRCMLGQHCEEHLHFHLLYVLQKMRKVEGPTYELKWHALRLEKSQLDNELSRALDVRSLTLAIKRQEAKIKNPEDDEPDNDRGEGQSQEKKIEKDKSEGDHKEDNAKENKAEGECIEGHSLEKNWEGDHNKGHSQENKTETDLDEGYSKENKFDDQGGGHTVEKKLEVDHKYVLSQEN